MFRGTCEIQINDINDGIVRVPFNRDYAGMAYSPFIANSWW